MVVVVVVLECELNVPARTDSLCAFVVLAGVVHSRCFRCTDLALSLVSRPVRLIVPFVVVDSNFVLFSALCRMFL